MKRPTNGQVFDLHGSTYMSTGCSVTLETDQGPNVAGTYLLAHRFIKSRGEWAANPTKLHFCNWS